MMTSPPELISFDSKSTHNCSMLLKSLGEHTTVQTQQLEAFLARLEEERLKIDAFKRELPICVQLLNGAMEASRQELLQSQRTKRGANLILEEFIPLKNTSTEEVKDNAADKYADRANWMASARLWNHDIEETDNHMDLNAKQRINYGYPELALASSHKEQLEDNMMDPLETIISRRSDNSGESSGNGLAAEKDHKNTTQTRRKARRCWSPDLHRRFVNALYMLGGSQG